ALQIRHRNSQPTPKHQARRYLLGHLIERRSGVDVARSGSMQHNRTIEQPRDMMCCRIAKVNSQCITSILLQERHQPLLDFREGIIPAHAQPPLTSAYLGLLQEIRVGVQLLEAIGFWTNIATTKNVLLVSPNGENFLTLCFDL